MAEEITEEISIEIDGRICTAVPGEMIIAVTDREGIPVPRFCYHEKLSIAANCRMCLVDASVDVGGNMSSTDAGAKGTADMLPGEALAPFDFELDGADRLTASSYTLQADGTIDVAATRSTPEHSMRVGVVDNAGDQTYAQLAVQDVGPLIAAASPDAGARYFAPNNDDYTVDLGSVEINTQVTKSLTIANLFGTDFGELTDLTFYNVTGGALTSKPYRFTARPWELTAEESIAPHDAVGSNLHLHTRDGRVMRVHPRDNEPVNETWISDRDRFSYRGLKQREPPRHADAEGPGRPLASGGRQEALHATADILRRSAAARQVFSGASDHSIQASASCSSVQSPSSASNRMRHTSSSWRNPLGAGGKPSGGSTSSKARATQAWRSTSSGATQRARKRSLTNCQARSRPGS